MSELNPAETIIRVPDEIVWQTTPDAPANSVAQAVLAGGENQSGQYLVLMKWYPGYMSAPHFYRTDRLCVVVSGVWWCNSGNRPSSPSPVWGPSIRPGLTHPNPGCAHFEHGSHPDQVSNLARPDWSGLYRLTSSRLKSFPVSDRGSCVSNEIDRGHL
jgi:hypothetical protein